MRYIHVLPLLAAAALAACSNDPDEALTDEALAEGDVIPVIEDNGVMPAPGEYSTREELVELDAPGMTEEQIAEMRSAFAEGAADPHLFCVTAETGREQWLSDMVESDCTISRLTANDTAIEGAMICSSEESFNGRVEIAGRTAQGGSNLRMTYVFPTEAGEGTVVLQVVSDPTGEPCS